MNYLSSASYHTWWFFSCDMLPTLMHLWLVSGLLNFNDFVTTFVVYNCLEVLVDCYFQLISSKTRSSNTSISYCTTDLVLCIFDPV